MTIGEKIKAQLGTYLKLVKEKVFGVNNEHLDFVMDSFYKLETPQRNGVLAIGAGLVVFFVISSFGLYFVQVKSLEDDLGASFKAISELKKLRVEEGVENNRFNQLVSSVKKKTRAIKFKPYFEKISSKVNVPIKNMNEKNIDIDQNNPLSEHLTEVHIDLRLAKVSIPRLLTFLIEIERSGRFLRVQNLRITGLYGNKLFFDSEIVVRGYKVKR